MIYWTVNDLEDIRHWHLILQGLDEPESSQNVRNSVFSCLMNWVDGILNQRNDICTSCICCSSLFLHQGNLILDPFFEVSKGSCARQIAFPILAIAIRCKDFRISEWSYLLVHVRVWNHIDFESRGQFLILADVHATKFDHARWIVLKHIFCRLLVNRSELFTIWTNNSKNIISYLAYQTDSICKNEILTTKANRIRRPSIGISERTHRNCHQWIQWFHSQSLAPPLHQPIQKSKQMLIAI